MWQLLCNLVAASNNSVPNQYYRPIFNLINFLFRWATGSAQVFWSNTLQASNLAGTYANGTAGVGATLTKASAGALGTIDGVTPYLGMTVLLTAQSTPAQNGLYYVTNLGSSSAAWVLTRWGGFNQSAEMINGCAFYITSGTTYAGQVWAYTAASSPTVGSTSLTFAVDSLLRAAIAATVTAAQAFAAGTLRILNSGATFYSTLASSATANRTVTFPDATFTVAQSAASTSSTAANSSAFTGTGQSSSGQVITTTDNQTMTLNQCAGMWFISATHGPYYIVSNTAVTGAPAVLTVIGDAPTTDAGAYRIVTTAHVHTQT